MTELEFGQTPWDNLSRADLLTEVQRLYSAVASLHGALDHVSKLSSGDPYFNLPNGSGGEALEKGRQAITRACRDTTRDRIYFSFLRYADDLLFDPPLGAGWLVDEAGQMVAQSREHSLIYHNAEASAAGLPHMRGYLRRLTWRDLEPTAWNAQNPQPTTTRGGPSS